VCRARSRPACLTELASGILLARLKHTFPQIRQAILDLDEERLSLDNLRALEKCLPTPDEAELIRDYDGDISALSKADQYFREIVGIPRLSERLSCMVFMRKFEMDLEELKPDLKVLRDAVDEVSASDKFKRVLQTVLLLGNMLNGSTFRGSAAGFQLGDLLKLRETKPAVPTPATPTLLHFLVRVLNRADKALVGYLDDCSHVEAAARLSTQSIMASVTAILAGQQQVREEAEMLSRTRIASAGDRFLAATTQFLASTNSQVRALQSAGEHIQADLLRLVAYYGDDPTVVRPEEFFGTIASFGQALMRAEAEVLEHDRKAELAAQKSAKAQFGAALRGAALRIPQPPAPEVRGPLASQANEASQPASSSVDAPSALAVTIEEADEAADVVSPVGSDLTPTAGAPGSRFRSWGASAAATMGDASSSGVQRGSYRGGRGQLDEAIKELRSGVRGDRGERMAQALSNAAGPGGTLSGRKSLRRQDTLRASHRPLSRVFLDA
jgi:hypothetical protein